MILRAFSSGCTALTGIEAISNGITAFKEPRSRNAAITLIWMSSLLIVMFLGITFLAHQIHAMPSETETVISQIGRTIYGDDSPLYLMMLAGTALILLMAANTSYADFPRLAALHAGDGFLPRQLTYRGSRLVFSWGIMGLATCASLLVIVSQARTTALIPLYAIGVFLSFTMSQTGMVVRLRKIGKLQPGEEVPGRETVMRYDPHWRLKIVRQRVWRGLHGHGDDHLCRDQVHQRGLVRRAADPDAGVYLLPHSLPLPGCGALAQPGRVCRSMSKNAPFRP